jgi:hypothetical protein
MTTPTESIHKIDTTPATIIEVREIKYDAEQKERFNQNNIRELTPFRAQPKDCEDDIDGPILYILDTFWNKLSQHPSAVENIYKYYTPNNIVIVGPECDFSHGGNDEAGYWTVYRAWCQMYNADKWFHVFGNLAALIPVSPACQKKLTGHRTLTLELEQDPEVANLLVVLGTEITRLQETSGCLELFIKTSAKSTKHDIPVQPITNAREALEYLLPSPTIQGVLARDEPVELFIRPWQPDVNNDNEIRVFIQDGRIKAVSQQYHYASSPVLGMLFRYSAADILDQIQEWWQRPEVQQLGYLDAVLDMYITPDSQVELIEINCGGNGWGPAGSSLFTWSEINSIPAGKCVFAYY